MNTSDDIDYDSVMQLIREDGPPQEIVENLLSRYPFLRLPFKLLLEKLIESLEAVCTDEGILWIEKHRYEFINYLKEF